MKQYISNKKSNNLQLSNRGEFCWSSPLRLRSYRLLHFSKCLVWIKNQFA